MVCRVHVYTLLETGNMAYARRFWPPGNERKYDTQNLQKSAKEPAPKLVVCRVHVYTLRECISRGANVQPVSILEGRMISQ